MRRLFEFFFSRWKRELYARGEESWTSPEGNGMCRFTYRRTFIEYKYTNKFDGSVKIKRKYLN